MKNESTTFNNIKIIENIYTRQFNLKVNDFIFHHVLQLIYEDFKTWSCICFVKKLRCDILKQSFNHFDWLLTELNLWHLHLNMLQLIHKIHWDDIESSDVSTLQYATDKWHQVHVIQLNDFQILEELIIHSYQAQMMSMWIKHLQCEKLDHRRIEETLLWLSMQTMNKSDSWLQVLNSISNRIHWFSLMTKVIVELSACDKHFNNYQNYCCRKTKSHFFMIHETALIQLHREFMKILTTIDRNFSSMTQLHLQNSWEYKLSFIKIFQAKLLSCIFRVYENIDYY